MDRSIAVSLMLVAGVLSEQVIAQTPPAQVQPAQQPAPAEPPQPQRSQRVLSVVEFLRREAGSLQGLVQGEDMRRLIQATSWLPVPESTTLFVRSEPRSVLTPEEHEALPEAERGQYVEKTYDQQFFYFTRYGSPMANLRPLQIAHNAFAEAAQQALDASNPEEGRKLEPNHFRGKSIVDFGFGSVAHLRLLASIGCFVQGVEVDPVLEKMYARDNIGGQGPIVGEVPASGLDERKPGPGFLNLVYGSWPSDPAIKSRVQGNIDLFVSKNTLKRGYVVPPEGREYDPKRMIDLGVSREEFVREVAGVLRPGGLFLIYNISPAQTPADQPSKPWADGRSPFEREMLESAGFELLAFDRDDADRMRDFAKVLGWDAGEQPMDLERDFVVQYTLARKK